MNNILFNIYGNALGTGMFEEFLNPDEKKIMRDVMKKWETKLKEQENERRRKLEETRAAYPLQYEPVNFTINDKVIYNIDKQRKYYYITCDGGRISPRMFAKPSITKCTGDPLDYINTTPERYIILPIVAIGEYDEEVMKHSKSKSKWYLFTRDCVFDTETKKVVFEAEDQTGLYTDKWMTLYNNLVSYNGEIIHLPTMKTCFKTSDKYCKDINDILESEDNICFKESRYNKNAPITVINKTTGNIITL